MKFLGCDLCKHFNSGSCKAFPKGIPLQVISGEIPHDRILKGQMGDYVFEVLDRSDSYQNEFDLYTTYDRTLSNKLRDLEKGR